MPDPTAKGLVTPDPIQAFHFEAPSAPIDNLAAAIEDMQQDVRRLNLQANAGPEGVTHADLQIADAEATANNLLRGRTGQRVYSTIAAAAIRSCQPYFAILDIPGIGNVAASGNSPAAFVRIGDRGILAIEDDNAATAAANFPVLAAVDSFDNFPVVSLDDAAADAIDITLEITDSNTECGPCPADGDNAEGHVQHSDPHGFAALMEHMGPKPPPGHY